MSLATGAWRAAPQTPIGRRLSLKPLRRKPEITSITPIAITNRPISVAIAIAPAQGWRSTSAPKITLRTPDSASHHSKLISLRKRIAE